MFFLLGLSFKAWSISSVAAFIGESPTECATPDKKCENEVQGKKCETDKTNLY